MMMKKHRRVWLALPLILTSLIVHSPAAMAVDCTKAPDSQSPACLALHKAGPEEVNSFSALAQKAAAQAAARAAAAKGIKPTITVTTPLAIVTPVPKLTPAMNTPSASPSESVIPVTLAPASKAAAKSSQSTKSKTSKIAKKPAPGKKAVTPKKSAHSKPVAPTQDKPSTTFANKVVTVECTNGKKIIKVTSAKPMCPAGYWRK